jgi:4-hydroxybenzoate polyprenyltransferase
MSSRSSGVSAYLELIRASNLPTCLSNVLVGAAIASAGSGGVLGAPRVPTDWAALAASAVAVCLFYAAGMALNDVCDAEIDRHERPSRPIPSGRISSRSALTFVIVCFVVGLGIMAPQGLPAALLALLLVILIVAYDLTHKNFVGAPLLMGSCRGLIYPMVAASLVWPIGVGVAVALGCLMVLFVIGITIVAGMENLSSPDRRRWLCVLLPVIVVSAATWVRPDRWEGAIVAAIVLVAWLTIAGRFLFGSRPRIIQSVLSYLSAICLIDAYFLTLLSRPDLGMIATVCFGLTALGHRRILGA